MRTSRLITVSLCVAFLGACSATKTAIQKHDLHVETRMSETIFLEPVAPEKKVVFVEVRNTSDKPKFDIAPEVSAALLKRGYSLTSNPDKAYFMLQANVLRVEKMDPNESDAELLGGYGETIGGTALGGVVGHQIGNHSRSGAIAGAVIGAAATTVINAFVTDDTYSVITDIKVSQRLKAKLSGDWDRYTTRVVSSANQANLDFEEAEKPLASGLAHSLAGMF